MATDIGCMPPSIYSIWTWLNDPRLAWKLVFDAVVPSQYFLTGGDVSEEDAKMSRDVILKGRSRL